MPFCAGRTTVSGPMSGGSSGAMGMSPCAFTASTTTSATPTSAASLVAKTLAVKSPSGLRTTTPRSRIAARCGPRAMSATSSPARLSLAPKYAPIAPAP